MRVSLCFRVFALAVVGAASSCLAEDKPVAGTTYPMVEASFELPGIRDHYFETNVWAELSLPSGGVLRLPAFYDGPAKSGHGVWRIRHTPSEPGRYAVAVFVGDPAQHAPTEVANFSNREFSVSGAATGHGFVRVSPRDPRRFQFDDGTAYYPIGFNSAWEKSRDTKMVILFDKMRAAGLNWTRIWMTHFYKSSNLDWVWGKPLKAGTLDLQVAKLWDERMRAAERNGIAFQLVLQHHGQYSTQVSSDWARNPWNARNGGFLESPEQFFTDPQALERTQMKWRYIVARWGYSPAIMAWELFNEVELTDAYTGSVAQAVTQWHDAMSSYLRTIDPYHHLITSSAPPLSDPLWRPLDYYQPHAYPQDLIARNLWLEEPARLLEKPIFFGEMGRGTEGIDLDDGRDLRRILWPSLMTGSAGASQYWSWRAVDQNNLWPYLTAATRFVALTGLAGHREGRLFEPIVTTEATADITFSGDGGWMKAPDAEVVVPGDGQFARAAGPFSAYIHGAPDKLAEGYPGAVTLRLDAGHPTAVSLTLAQVSHFGSSMAIDIDGVLCATNAWPTTRTQVLRRKPVDVTDTVSVPVPAGPHSVRIRSLGPDWFLVNSFRVQGYVPALQAVARGTPTGAVAWVMNRSGIDYPPLPPAAKHAVAPPPGTRPPPASGTVTLTGLEAGSYGVTWWDTSKGCEISHDQVTHSGGPLTVATPPIASDAALWVYRTGDL